MNHLCTECQTTISSVATVIDVQPQAVEKPRTTAMLLYCFQQQNWQDRNCRFFLKKHLFTQFQDCKLRDVIFNPPTPPNVRPFAMLPLLRKLKCNGVIFFFYKFRQNRPPCSNVERSTQTHVISYFYFPSLRNQSRLKTDMITLQNCTKLHRIPFQNADLLPHLFALHLVYHMTKVYYK